MPLRDTDKLLYPAVCETIAALGLGSEDAAAVRLARLYAQSIDEAPDTKAQASRLRWTGPELLKVLESLGATPAARAAMKQPKDQPPAQVSKLDQLRAARQKRA